jgi:hypothetical protein
MKLVVTFKAANEFEALTIRDLLRQHDVPATIRSREFPMLDAASMMYSFWGEVLVHEENLARATELIAGFKGSLGELAEAEEPEAG